MKTYVGYIALLLGGLLAGCHSPTPTQEQLTPMQQSYRGTLYCDRCEGIDAALYLDKNGTFTLERRYRGEKRSELVTASFGIWARTADKLTLTDNNTGEKLYFRPRGISLELLDGRGAPRPVRDSFMLSPARFAEAKIRNCTYACLDWDKAQAKLLTRLTPASKAQA